MFDMKNTIFLFAFFSNLTAFSRLASMQEANVRSKTSIKIFVEADGKEKIILHQESTLLTEAARQGNATINLSYFADSYKFDVLKAEVSHPDGNINSVDLSTLTREKKPGTSQLIDDSMSISVPFPNVEIGSTLIIDSTFTALKIPIPGSYSFSKDFEDIIYSQDSRIDFESKTPLFYSVTKDSLWEILEEKIEGEYPYQYHFRLKEDYFYSVVSEEGGNRLEDVSTRIIVSNKETFKEIYQNVAVAFEAELNKSTQDPFFISALEQAVSRSNFDEKIDVLIHALHDKTFVYYFDLRKTERKCFPRSLEDIFSNKQADCKAFALILSMWLRELGYEAFPALVYNGKYDRQWPSLPRTSETNHAIVLCLVDGQEIWIDPTFFFSTGKWIPEHMLNRNAIVLNPKDVNVKKISLSEPESSIDYEKSEIVRIDEENIKVLFLKEEKGASPISTFSYFFGVPIETVVSSIEEGYSKGVSYKNSEISAFNLTSRKIQDLSYSACFIFDSEEFCKKQGMHKLLPFEEEDADSRRFIWNIEISSEALRKVLKMKTSSYEQGYYLGRPGIEISEVTIEPIMIEKLPKEAHVDTPWFSFTRSFSRENQRLKMIEKVVYKTDRIQNAELKSQAFLEAQKAIKIGGVSLCWVSE